LQLTVASFVASWANRQRQDPLINVLTGIDRPTHGEVFIANTAVHKLDEGQLAAWREQTWGCFPVFPAAAHSHHPGERAPANGLWQPLQPRLTGRTGFVPVDLVGIAEHAYKLPSRLSGGHSRARRSARALANDPKSWSPMSRPATWNSRTAEQVFTLLSNLAPMEKPSYGHP